MSDILKSAGYTMPTSTAALHTSVAANTVIILSGSVHNPTAGVVQVTITVSKAIGDDIVIADAVDIAVGEFFPLPKKQILESEDSLDGFCSATGCTIGLNFVNHDDDAASVAVAQQAAIDAMGHRDTALIHSNAAEGFANAAAASAAAAIISGQNIELVSSLAVNQTSSGSIAPWVCGEPLTIGDTCYINPDGKMWKSDADAEATMPVVVMATESGVMDETKNFLFVGFFRDDSYAWATQDIGKPIYASGIAGEVTVTAPSGTTNTVQAVGFVFSASTVFFSPSLVTAGIV